MTSELIENFHMEETGLAKIYFAKYVIKLIWETTRLRKLTQKELIIIPSMQQY